MLPYIILKVLNILSNIILVKFFNLSEMFFKKLAVNDFILSHLMGKNGIMGHSLMLQHVEGLGKIFVLLDECYKVINHYK